METLALDALRRFGDGAPDLADQATILMMVTLANEVLEDIRSHPYWDGTDLPYYVHPTDVRPVPDIIMLNGLLALYAFQQSSAKAAVLIGRYRQVTNQVLWERRTKNARPRMIVVDNGSSATAGTQKIDPLTGRVIGEG